MTGAVPDHFKLLSVAEAASSGRRPDMSDDEGRDAAFGGSEDVFRSAFVNSTIGVAIVTAKGRFIEANAAYCAITGYSHEELAETHFDRIIHPEDYGENLRVLRTMLGGEAANFVIRNRYLRKDGEIRWVQKSVSLVRDAQGEPLRIIALVEDITDRKLADDEVRKLNEELELRVIRRTAELEAANKELEAFSYSVSHDLRAPLRAVDGCSKAVLEDFGAMLPEEGRRYLQSVRQGAQKMGALIDDLLAFSRLGRAPLNRRTVDMGWLVREVIKELGPQQEGRRIDWVIGCLPLCAGDTALLKQVWLNLLGNAVKYTGRTEAAVIEVGSTPVQNEPPSYWVRDNGAGFDMRYSHKLFGVFQRLHRAEDYAGTGVGLAIVQRVVHRHSGRVWAVAAVNQGATFYFNIGTEEPK